MRIGPGVALVLLLATGCKPVAARLASSHPAAPTLEVSGPLRWHDRAAGEIEARIACRRTTVEVWCREQGRTHCESSRVVAEPVSCPAEVITLWTRRGATGQATVPPDGRAIFAMRAESAGPGTTSSGARHTGLRIERAGRVLGWRDGDRVVTEAERAAPPKSRPPQRSYAKPMVLTDLAILISAPLVIRKMESTSVAIFYAVAHVVGGPIIHAANGNRPGVGRSLARRLLYPVVGGAVGLIGGVAASAGCTGELCGLGALGVAALGGGLGMVGAVVHDWTDAHVDAAPSRLAPVIASDGERTLIGVTGRF